MGRLSGLVRAVFRTERRQGVVFTLILLPVGWQLAAAYFQAGFPIDEPVFFNFTALVVGMLWMERLFTPPRDAAANAFTGLALTLCLLRDPVYIRSLLIGLAVYYGVVLVSALFASWRQGGEAPGPIGWAYGLSYAFAVSWGKASVVYSLAFLATLTPLAKAGNEYALARFLLLWVGTVSLPHFIQQLRRLFGEEAKQPIGLVTSATSPMNVEALIPKGEVVSVGDVVGIKDTCRLCNESHPVTCYGRVINVYSDRQTPQGARKAQMQIYGAYHTQEGCVRKKNPFGLYEVVDVLGVGQQIERFSDLGGVPDEVRELPVFARHGAAVGYVLDHSSVEKLRFAVYPHKVVRRGDVVVVALPGADLTSQLVYYQVLDVTTSDEEPTRPPFAMQYASAAQVGAIEDGGRFRTCDLTPYVRTPVWLGSETPRDGQAGAFRTIGVLPRTSIPVNVDLNALVVYHTAILGTTGSGKTTLLRELASMIASRGIKVLVVDSHNEFSLNEGAHTTCVLTICSPDVRQAFDSFLKSDEFETLIEKMGAEQTPVKDARKEAQTYAAEQLFADIGDVRIRRGSLGRTAKDQTVKKILDQFMQQWYPRRYLMRTSVQSTDADCLSVLDRWYAENEAGKNRVLIVKLHNLSIDERRWGVGLIAERLLTLASDQGLTLFLQDTGDPRARVSIVLEEAHTFAPETGFSIGEDENARRYCARQLRNLMLHARKYGLGVIVASQRSAFIDKGVLSQCNTLFAMKTVSVNDKRVFEDFMDSDWVRLVTYLGTPPESPQAILVGKAAASSIPLIIEYEATFPSQTADK